MRRVEAHQALNELPEGAFRFIADCERYDGDCLSLFCSIELPSSSASSVGIDRRDLLKPEGKASIASSESLSEIRNGPAPGDIVGASVSGFGRPVVGESNKPPPAMRDCFPCILAAHQGGQPGQGD